MKARENQLYQNISIEKEKLNQIVKCQQDLNKQDTLEQSWKLDKLVVLAMKEQLQRKVKGLNN